LEERLKKSPVLVVELLKLKDKNLGCWCHPEPCHGDVLLELINKYYKIRHHYQPHTVNLSVRLGLPCQNLVVL